MSTFKLSRTDAGREVDGHNLQWETSPMLKTPCERGIAATVYVQDDDLRPADVASRLRSLADAIESKEIDLLKFRQRSSRGLTRRTAPSNCSGADLYRPRGIPVLGGFLVVVLLLILDATSKLHSARA